MRNFKTICLLILAAFAVYGPSLRNGFVWDDTALVLRDPLIRSWRLIPEGFRQFLFTDATASDFYRPLQRLTFTFDYALWGFSPGFYHLTNLLLHAFAAAALFLFAFELTRRWLPAALAALIWVIHPLNSSAVIYVAGRADLLAALFGFGALWLALKHREGVAAACFFLALLSKESAFAFLLMWVVIVVGKRQFKILPRWGLLLALVVGAYLLLRLTAEHETPPRVAEVASLAARPILMARSAALYTSLFLFPANLHMERDLIALAPFATLDQARHLQFLTLAGVALAIAGGYLLRKSREPLVWICFGCGLLAYLPISNAFSLNATFAEHWFYIPGAFLLLAVAMALASAPQEVIQKLRVPGTMVLALWICFLGVRTFLRNADWKDARTFLTRTIASGGETSRMWTNLGSLCLSEGNPRAALECFQNAMKAPQPFALIGIASAEIKLGDYSGARAHIDEALKNPFVRPAALQNLATLEYLESGKDRIDLLWEAADLAPKNWAIQKKFLLHLAERGHRKEAIKGLRSLLETQSYRAESWEVLGDLLRKEGEGDLANAAYKEASLRDVHWRPQIHLK